MNRREYRISITVNKRSLEKAVIDPHYEENHSKSIDDDIILELVKSLDGSVNQPESVDEEGFEYYVTEPIELNDRSYRLVWLLHEKEIYIGVVNAFRR